MRMPTLTSLPVDILRCILPLLERDTLAELAQTCQLFYTLARPLLFKHLIISLDTHNGYLNCEKLQRDLDILERVHAGQKLGALIERVYFLSDSGGTRSNSRPWDAISTGYVSGLVELLSRLPNLNQITIDSPPSILRQEPDVEMEQYTTLANKLKDASPIDCLAFIGLPGTDCTRWLQLLLGSLAADLVTLDLSVDLESSIGISPSQSALSLPPLPRLAYLRVSGVGGNATIAALVDCLLIRSQQLVGVHLESQFITPSNIRNMVRKDTTLRSLRLTRCMLPEVENVMSHLSQLQLLHLSVLDCEANFFYWLPRLPISLKELCCNIQADDIHIPNDQSSPVAFVYGSLGRCFQDPNWCPNLASLDILFEGEMGPRDDVYCRNLEPDARKALLDEAILKVPTGSILQVHGLFVSRGIGRRGTCFAHGLNGRPRKRSKIH